MMKEILSNLLSGLYALNSDDMYKVLNAIEDSIAEEYE